MSFARVRAFVVVGVLGVAALVFVVIALLKDTQTGARAGSACPDGAVRVNASLIRPEEIKVRVLNGTGQADFANQVNEEFKNRKFQVQKPGNAKKVENEVAVLRYGPKTLGAGQLLRAYFLNRADFQFDPNRKDDVVDVIIGPDFQALATQTEVNQSIGELGEPSLPPGTCRAEKA
jgi:hypothetical protein